MNENQCMGFIPLTQSLHNNNGQSMKCWEFTRVGLSFDFIYFQLRKTTPSNTRIFDMLN
jgi:hypothetical protein